MATPEAGERLWVLVDPTSAPDAGAHGQLAPRPHSLAGKRLAVVDNRKAGSSQILERLAARLEKDYGVAEVRFFYKETSAKPVDPELVREIAGAADLAVAGIGD